MNIPRAGQLRGPGAAPKLLAALALAAALAGAVLQAPAAAQQLSPGCEQINGAIYDNLYGQAVVTNSFLAGEQLSISAGSPATATQFSLSVNGVPGSNVDIPGTITYTFAASAMFTLQWKTQPSGLATWTVTCTAAIAATFRGLSATTTKRGVVVRWRTASEVDALGFNVYRAVQGTRVRANARLIPARGVGAYSFLDRAAPRARTLRYWIQLVNLDGSRSWYGPARVAGT